MNSLLRTMCRCTTHRLPSLSSTQCSLRFIAAGKRQKTELFRQKTVSCKQYCYPDVRSRPATHADLHDVLDCGSYYNQRLCLKNIFPQFVESDDVVPRVYFKNDQLLGFSAVQLIDGGQTAWLRVLHVKEEFRCQGYSIPIGLSMLSEFPDVQTRVMTTTDNRRTDSRNFLFCKLRTLKELCKKRIIDRRFTSKGLVVSDKEENSVVSVSAPDLMSMCENKVVCDRFFPERRICAHSVYLKLMPENFGELFNKKSQIYVTLQENDRVLSDATSGALSDATSGALSGDYIANIDTVSTAHYNTGACGLVYHVDVISGSCQNSVPSHIEYHVRQMKRLAGDGGVLMLTFGDDLGEDIVTSCLQKHGLTEPFTAGERYIITNEVCC